MNEKLALYRDAIKSVAEKRGLPFANLYPIEFDSTAASDNGMHLTEEGYKSSTVWFLSSLKQGIARGTNADRSALRLAVVAKNEQFFNKWRPQNETYLFGFRKHEQGKNAKEIVEFDPFIKKAEDEIAKLRKELK